VAAAEIEDLIARLESINNTSSIDVVVLANLVRACFELALKKGELIDLSIEDVAKGGVVRDIIRIGDDKLNLSELPHAKQILQKHIDYLKKNGYPRYAMKPLFPTRKKTRYNERTLDNHLKTAQDPNTEYDISIEKIRQAGVSRYYEKLRDQGISPRDCLNKTAEFARISQRQAKDLLIGNIQPTGKKTSLFLEYLEKIEMIEFELPIYGNNTERQALEQIRCAIEKDSKLNDGEKRALESEINSKILKIEKPKQIQNSHTKEPQFNSLAQAIKSSESSDESTPDYKQDSLEEEMKKYDS
jgi:hypothetical protein